MIRKIYIDFIKERISQGKIGWLLKKGVQYFLVYCSYVAGKPLCGPILGTLVTNYACNYHCKMCDLPERERALKAEGFKEFSTQQLKGLIKEFAQLGVGGIGFTGGEPLLRKDIFELIKYTRSLGMFAHLNTNGFFIDQEIADKLFDAGTDSINISLDGATAKTHDAIRNHAGAFDKVIRAAKIIKVQQKKNKKAIRFKLVSVIGQVNIDEVPALIKLSRDLDADCIEFIPEQGFSANKDSASDVDKGFLEKVNRTVDYLLDQKKKGQRIENSLNHLRLFANSFKGDRSPLRCYAGYNSYAVDCYGQIYPCVPWVNWQKSVGIVKERSLKELWYSEELNKSRKEIDRCKDCYLNCQAELNILFNLFK